MLYRAQAVLRHISGLPKDNVSNTFWFDDGAAGFTVARAEEIAEAVRDFYVADHGAGIPLMNHLSAVVADTLHQVKVAPIDVATGDDERGEGFPPLWTEAFDFLGATEVRTRVVSEVAACLSYRNDSNGDVPAPRRRGRVFIGPLGLDATVIADGVLRVHENLRNSMLSAGNFLRSNLGIPFTEWVVYSRPFAGRGEVVRPGRPTLPAIPARAGSMHSVETLWVDNAFDTQRRRGEAATARTFQ